MSTELIYGLHAVTAALRHHTQQVQSLWLAGQNSRLRAVADMAAERGINAQHVPRQELDRLSHQARHQGVVAQLNVIDSSRSEADLPQLLAECQPAPLLLVLDGIQDPHNLGACLRTAEAAGVNAVIVPTDRAVGLTASVRKVAAGAAETVPLITVTNLARALRRLQETGIWLVGAAGEAPTSLYHTDLNGPVALVLGAEDKGLRRLTREHCDQLVRIPMAGEVASLNVSVATGVVLFEAVRQRILAGQHKKSL